MPITDKDIVAKYFFDLADKVQDLGDTEAAQKLTDVFDESDFASVVATLLDAAYWIRSGDLALEMAEEEETGELDPMGHDLYVASSVYNDLLYRGYNPQWAWEESGLEDMFEDTPIGAENVENPEVRKSSVTPYYAASIDKHGVVGGIVLGKKMFSFDGKVFAVPEGVSRISKDTAMSMLDKYASQIIASYRVHVERLRS